MVSCRQAGHAMGDGSSVAPGFRLLEFTAPDFPANRSGPRAPENPKIEPFHEVPENNGFQDFRHQSPKHAISLRFQ